MSVIQRIRDKGAWIIFGIIALALIAFILQDGVGRGKGAVSNSTTIGKVNGVTITKAEFEETLAMQEQMYAQQGATREQLIAPSWQQKVEEVLLNQEFEKLGLQVSPKELSDILFGENSPLRQQFTDPKTGVFMVDKAKEAIANVKKSKNAEEVKMLRKQLLDPTIQQALRTKYQALMIQSAYVPKWLLDKQAAEAASISNISYVYVPYMSVSDSAVKVSDDDINAYVSKHKKQFTKTEETRNIAFVGFSTAPTAADSANARAQVENLKADFAAATDMPAFFTKNSSDLGYYDSYISKSQMQQTNKDTLANIPAGTVYGPYQDGRYFMLAKKLGNKQWPDSAKVRHILIMTMNPQSGQFVREDSTAKKLIDSIETAVKGGANFDALVAQYSDDGGSKDKGGVYDFFQTGRMVPEFNDFAFDKPVGSKGVVKVPYGYHYVEVLGQKNVGPAYKIAYLARPIMASSETVSTAQNTAAQFGVSAKDNKSFNANAAKANLPVLGAADIKENDFTINGLAGMNRQLVRWIYEHGNGDVSEPFEAGDQYIVAIITGVNKAGLMSAAEARPMVEPIVRNEKKAKQIIETKFKGNTLESYASSTGAPVLRADSVSFAAPFVPNVGNEPKVVGAAFNKALAGKASEPFGGNTGVFAVKVEQTGTKPMTQDLETLKSALLQASKMASYRSLEALKKEATIKDYRSKFY
ncbi:peptidylprolyl isomerase [Sediminibacterium roseum]|uniref:Periplasmic chaperone PpiD n=1 Tax=Sediminibacterium roseum TaxID=1978412 RepID=A0ABW9ZMM1_9BACT|nr:peptidylprolyl isomerase [Sediminibacterium roseum]NCI48314.1 peptidylprolyl isomerase [Sediminibacterium roseum]